MARLERITQIETPESAPRYELRVRRHGPVGTEYEIWQMPAIATPQVVSPLRVAGLRGRNFELVEHRMLRRSVDNRQDGYALTEDLGADTGVAVPHARPHAQPRQYAGGGRGH